MKFFNSHLSAQQIADAIDNLLPENERGELQIHLASCEHCAKEFAALEKAIGLLRRDDSENAPDQAVKFVVNLYRTRKRFVPKQSVTQKILATLKLDVSPFAPAFGERSAAASAEKQMLFEAGDFDLDLRIRAAENGFDLVGQVLGEIETQSDAVLENRNYLVKSEIDEENKFLFEKIPAGTYDLRLKTGDRQIIVSDLTIE